MRPGGGDVCPSLAVKDRRGCLNATLKLPVTRVKALGDFLLFTKIRSTFSMTDLSNIKRALYIKLGASGEWEDLCLSDGTLRLDYNEVPYEIAIKDNKDEVAKLYLEKGSTKGSASDHARQVSEFYHTGEDTLWITFSKGYLWWCVSNEPPSYIGTKPEEYSPQGSHMRKTIGGWSNKSLAGTVLHISDLSGNLISTGAYRQTICGVKTYDYLMRKLQDKDLPEIKAIKENREQIIGNIEDLIKMLSWQDFELLVEMLFSRSGWQRISALGSTQKTLDLELLLPMTNERAIVQVKSSTNQVQLNEYVERFTSMNADKYLYVYHSSNTKIELENDNVILMDCRSVAEKTLSLGLVDWLINKVG